MSLNFTVQKVEEYQGIPEGTYTAQVDNIEYRRTDFGNYYIVNWKILSPSEFEGKTHQERYNIESDNEQVKSIAINNFSKFCMEIGGCKEGDEPKEEDFLYKNALIYIRHRVGKNDGKNYANITKMSLVDANKPSDQLTSSNPEKTAAILALAGIQVPTKPILSSEPLNDDVPF